MKTTIELPDSLFRSAKLAAQQRQTSLRALMEEGLRRVLSDDAAPKTPAFVLADARVHGQEMLIADPRQWHQLEEHHVLGRVIKPKV